MDDKCATEKLLERTSYYFSRYIESKDLNNYNYLHGFYYEGFTFHIDGDISQCNTIKLKGNIVAQYRLDKFEFITNSNYLIEQINNICLKLKHEIDAFNEVAEKEEMKELKKEIDALYKQIESYNFGELKC